MNFFRNAYSVVNAILVLEFLAQFLFIGVALFTITQAHDDANSVYVATNSDLFVTAAGLHAQNGITVVPITIVLLIIFSFAARYPWKTTGLTALLLPLMVVQIALPFLSFGSVFPHVELVSALHPVNGTILFGLALWLLVTRWAFGKRGQKMVAGAKS